MSKNILAHLIKYLRWIPRWVILFTCRIPQTWMEAWNGLQGSFGLQCCQYCFLPFTTTPAKLFALWRCSNINSTTLGSYRARVLLCFENFFWCCLVHKYLLQIRIFEVCCLNLYSHSGPFLAAWIAHTFPFLRLSLGLLKSTRELLHTNQNSSKHLAVDEDDTDIVL